MGKEDIIGDYEITATFVGDGECSDCGDWGDDLMLYHRVDMVLCDDCAKLHTDLTEGDDETS